VAPDYGIRVVKRGTDEIGVLCDGFNEMLGQIQKREVERDSAIFRTREKSHFLANMSHELRTPLNSIIGFSDVLLEKLKDRVSPKELKFIGNINTSGQHLLGIINNILDLSKIEEGKMEIHPESFSFPAVVDEVAALMRGVSGARDIRLKIDVPGSLPSLEADPVRVKQILYNLLSNAVKFSPDGSIVRLTADVLPGDRSAASLLQKEPALQFAVIDQGIGISPSDHEVIFHEFRQVDGSADRPFEGTGLGLALVKSFVGLHAGRVEVRSARGHGATFTVTLPLRFRGMGSTV
jgi:signal transduction histidine kinase